MSSIGPQLPSSLSKRKRDSNDDLHSDPSSPQPKHPRSNAEEIDLSSSDDDGFCPSVPAQKPPVAGPTLPTNTNEIDIGASNSDESDTGPAPPPSIGIADPVPAGTKTKPEESESDSDDGYGPVLPSSKPTIGPSLPPSATDDSSASRPQQRDDWMLAPPSASSGYSERDPSKLRARKFASKPSAGGSKADAEISSIWTETPEEKLKRLQDSVLGRSGNGPQQQSGSAAAAEKKSREDAERNRRIAENIERGKKGKSLVEEHQERMREKGRKVEDDDDDPSKRAFDREKDMAIGGRMGGKERREMMTQAKGFSGRFERGSYL